MKKKYIGISLLVIGILLILASIILTVIATSGINIIGGADLPTFIFAFTHAKNGLYSTLAHCGIISVVASVLVYITAKRSSK